MSANYKWTPYEWAINQYIPLAVEYANKRVVDKFGEKGRIAIQPSQQREVKLDDMPYAEQLYFEKIIAFWNRCYHGMMVKMTVRAGLRKMLPPKHIQYIKPENSDG